MGYRYFTGTTQKDPLEYAVGETILFKLRAMEDDTPLAIPYISYSLIGDDGIKNDFSAIKQIYCEKV